MTTGNGAIPFRPTVSVQAENSGISSAERPHRLAAAAGSLEAGVSVSLPFSVFNSAILRGVSGFVKRQRKFSLFGLGLRNAVL